MKTLNFTPDSGRSFRHLLSSKNIILLFGLMFFCLSFLCSQTLGEHWWVPNGNVWSIVTAEPNNLVYLGGEFTDIGPNVPYVTLVDENGSALTGDLSGSVTITTVTVVSGTWLGNTTGWFLPENWCGGVPDATSDVIIPSGLANYPEIAAAGAQCHDITIEAGASLIMSGTHTLEVAGNWENNGSFTAGSGTVAFTGSGILQTISGYSSTTFNILKVEKGAHERVLEVTALISLTASSNPLVIASGTFKLSSASIITPFSTNAGATISTYGGFWNNGGTINTANLSWNISGLFRHTAGSTNIGTSSGNSLIYGSGAVINVEGGTVNIAGRISPFSISNIVSYNQSGGVVTVCKVGSASSTYAPFDIRASGSSFKMSDGVIAIQKPSSNNSDYINFASVFNVTGGTLQIGNDFTTGSPEIRINSSVPVWNMTIHPVGTPVGKLVSNDLVIFNDLLISAGTVVDAAAFDINLDRNWTNEGLFTAGLGKVKFKGASLQVISGATSTTFNHLEIANTGGGVSLANDVTIGGVLTFTQGIVNTGIYAMVVNNDSPGAIAGGNALCHIDGSLLRGIASGINSYTFPLGSASGFAPVVVNFTAGTDAGILAAHTFGSDHNQIGTSNINPFLSVNRTWTFDVISGLGTANYDATFNWPAGDEDPAFVYSTAICGKYSVGVWSYPTMGSLTSTSAQITGETGFSDFQIGNIHCQAPDVPGVAANPPVICAGTGSTLTITSGGLNDGTAWQWYEGSCGGTPVGSVTSINVNPMATTTYYARGEGGCVTPGTCASVTVTVHPTAVFDGYLTYNNTANTALSGVQIALKQGVVTQHTAYTGTDGYFNFPAVCPGVYDVVVTSGASVSGINSTDAAQVNYWSVNYGTIPVVRYLSGDVNGSQTILSGDAANIQQHFITQGNPSVSFASDWVFWKAGETIGSNQGPAGYPSITITEGSTSLSQNFYGLVTGDFNRSFTPGAKEIGFGSITIVYNGVIKAAYNETIELPILSGQDMKIGAVSMILGFPAELMEIENVFLGEDLTNPVPFNVSGDELRVSWHSLSPVSLLTGDRLVTLMVKATGDAGDEGILFTVAADPLNELADGSFEVISNAMLSVAILQTTVLGTSEVADGGEISFSNQPNPFRGTTDFIYSLPAEGKVSLEVYDLLGARIKMLVDETQPAGEHLVKIEQNTLLPGVYAAVLKYESNGNMIVRTIKIISK